MKALINKGLPDGNLYDACICLEFLARLGGYLDVRGGIYRNN
jgi:hypothetical protein